MNTTLLRRSKIILSFCTGWMIGFVFLAIVRGSGTIEEGSVELELGASIGISVLLGILFGAFAGFAQIWIEERAYRRISLLRLLSLRMLFALASLTLLILAGYAVMTIGFGVSVGFRTFVFEPGSAAIYFYVLCVDLFLVLLRQVNLQIGEGNLWRLVTGRFYTPREEERIFMFLDLKSSTTLAESLGHLKYSMLIQDCYDDLAVVSENDAQIYQYVGDGVVLTWYTKRGLANNNCIRAYFSFCGRLASRSSYYVEKYQTQPRFTAGVHTGAVVVTEVGRHKREIAYHGDVLNTAARIQGKCKDFDCDLLITDILRRSLGPDEYTYESIGKLTLRGKHEPVSIVSVTAL